LQQQPHHPWQQKQQARRRRVNALMRRLLQMVMRVAHILEEEVNTYILEDEGDTLRAQFGRKSARRSI
jgi:hypothetical protein